MVRPPPPRSAARADQAAERQRRSVSLAARGACVVLTRVLVEYKEAFALFDKKGTGAVPREVLGDLLRALGQNPTQAEVADIVASAPRDGACIHPHNPTATRC